ncbi:thiamine transporter 1-like [Euwallacea similis]|uniref:thiamine transporter 1-like n=1 Tax=Euwallacea similis TaxID=1736056 RepID=UPI00344E3921
MLFKGSPKTGEESWLTVSLPLCVFGFLKELRPSEPFIYEFLVGPEWRNLTEDQVNQQVYPVGTYSYLGLLILVFLITDICRYKPLIVFSGISGIVVWGMLLYTTSLLELQILEGFYGAFAACEVAYFTYIYAKVDKDYYSQVTSHTRAAILGGRAISGILGQILVSFHVMDYRQLNYITFGSMIVATSWSFFLSPVKQSIYFHRNPTPQTLSHKSRFAFSLMWDHFKEAYSSKYLIKWSIWWSFATCGFIQVQVYMQPLWAEIVKDPDSPIYNGAVESILTILGFLGTLAAGVLKVDWKTRGELALTCCSLLQGFAMLIASQTDWILVGYICYVVFGTLFHLTITVASSEIAKLIKEDSYGLIFGLNTFIALLFQTIMTLVVVTKNVGFALPPRSQYFVYGVFHLILGCIYIIIGLSCWLASKRDYRRASTVPDQPSRTVIIY